MNEQEERERYNAERAAEDDEHDRQEARCTSRRGQGAGGAHDTYSDLVSDLNAKLDAAGIPEGGLRARVQALLARSARVDSAARDVVKNAQTIDGKSCWKAVRTERLDALRRALDGEG